MTKILKCDSNGMINVKDIIIGINKNHGKIIDSIAYTDTVKSEVRGNTALISSLENRIVAIENSTPADQDEVDAIKVDVKNNKLDITDNRAKIITLENDAITTGGKIAKNTSDIADMNVLVLKNGSDIMSVQNDVGNNSFSINDHEKRISSIETILGSGKSDNYLSVFSVPKNTGGGDAAPMTWVQRNIGTEVVNGIGAVSGGTSVTLPSGSYMVHAVASASGENQSRLNIGGSSYMYGTHCSDTGQSIIIAEIELTSASSISVETIVATSSADETLGKKSTLSDDTVFFTLYIRKQS